jgi:hypothetical protein
MNAAVAKIDEQLPLQTQQQTENNALLSMIERAARDPAVDIDKMERLMKMHTDMVMQKKQELFDAAMQRAQGKMRRIATDSQNAQTRSRYASYAALDRAVRPIYTEEGFALSFDTGEVAQADMVRVICYVSNSGFTRPYHTDMPSDGKGAKGGDVMTKTHATGSAYSYGQRYLLKLIFNLAIGEDDDGNKAGGGFITEAQAEEIKKIADEIGTELDNLSGLYTGFFKKFRIEKLTDLPAKEYQNAKTALELKRKPK